jgi:hypothetical protein
MMCTLLVSKGETHVKRKARALNVDDDMVVYASKRISVPSIQVNHCFSLGYAGKPKFSQEATYLSSSSLSVPSLRLLHETTIQTQECQMDWTSSGACGFSVIS